MTTIASWISKQPDRCGGDACIRDTRITVWGIVNYRRLGLSDAEILAAIQGLTPVDLEAALEYAAANPEEIVRAIVENEEGEEGLMASTCPSAPAGQENRQSLVALASGQGILGPQNFDALFGAGKDLWTDEEDFQAFQDALRESRRTGA